MKHLIRIRQRGQCFLRSTILKVNLDLQFTRLPTCACRVYLTPHVGGVTELSYRCSTTHCSLFTHTRRRLDPREYRETFTRHFGLLNVLAIRISLTVTNSVESPILSVFKPESCTFNARLLQGHGELCSRRGTEVPKRTPSFCPDQ